MKAYARRIDAQRRNRLPERQVAGRPGVRAREMAGKKPFRRPDADAAERDESRAHLVVGERCERVQVDVGTGEADDVLGLPPRETEGDELLLARAGEPLTR